MNIPPNDTPQLPLPKLIGLGFRARAGKDTVGDILCRYYDYDRVAFGDKLKEVAGLLCSTDAFDPDFKNEVQIGGLTGRQVLLGLGKAIREIHPDFFIEAALIPETMSWSRAVVTDVRLPNEAAYIKKLGGVLIEVRRPGLPEDPDPTETGGQQIKWDHTIVNAGSLDDLERMVTALLSAICTPVAAPDTKLPDPAASAPTTADI